MTPGQLFFSDLITEYRSRLEANHSIKSRTREYYLERLDAIRGNCRDDLTWFMLYAANCRVVGEGAEAVRAYTRALALYQRPEIYYNRGMTLIGMGRVDEAIADLTIAARFMPQFLEELDGETRRRVAAAAGLP